MSDEQKTQQLDKNSSDIRKFKIAVPVIWAIGILITASGILWEVAVHSANKDNAEINFRADQERQSQGMKSYFDSRIQQLRTKDSTDISTVSLNVVNLINQNAIQTSGEIRLLREQCRRMMSSGGTLMHTYDNNGNVVPGVNRLSRNNKK